MFESKNAIHFNIIVLTVEILIFKLVLLDAIIFIID